MVKTKNYTEIKIEILNSAILTEVRAKARQEVEYYVKHQDQKISELNKSVQQLQKLVSIQTTKLNRLESQLKK